MSATRRPRAPSVDRGPILTAQQVGQLLQVKPREVVRFIRQRGLPAVHLGKKLGFRVREADLWTWLDRLRENGRAK
jgi:excisionase family DNA binding protein